MFQSGHGKSGHICIIMFKFFHNLWICIYTGFLFCYLFSSYDVTCLSWRLFFEQISCVCTGGWRPIWDLPTVQLFSGFLIWVTGKRLALQTPVLQCFPAVLGKKTFKLHSDFTLMKLLNLMMKIFHTWFRKVTPRWRNATNLIISPRRHSERFSSDFYTLTLLFCSGRLSWWQPVSRLS